MKKLTTLILVSAFIGGCATWQPAHYKRSALNLGGEDQSQGILMVWDSSLSAAVYKPGGANSKGENIGPTMCAQAARTARTGEGKANAVIDGDVAAAILAGTSAGNKLGVDGDEKVGGGAYLAETVSKLIETSEATTFLDTGMFYLCQIAANNEVSSDELGEMVTSLITVAGAIKSNSDNER